MYPGEIVTGWLIKPDEKSIERVELRADSDGSILQEMYKHLQCDYVEVGRHGLAYLPSQPDDDIWFDEEGLFRDYEYGFEIPNWVPILGRGLILGYNHLGDCTSSTLTNLDIEELFRTITFHTVNKETENEA
jgi:hypothetical protein